MPQRAKHTHLCPIVTADPKAVDQDGACPPGGSRAGPLSNMHLILVAGVGESHLRMPL